MKSSITIVMFVDGMSDDAAYQNYCKVVDSFNELKADVCSIKIVRDYKELFDAKKKEEKK